MKRVLIIVAALILALSLAACGGSKPGDKTKAFFKDFDIEKGLRMDVEMSIAGAQAKLEMHVKGEKQYVSVETGGRNVVIISDGTNAYMLDPTTKAGMKIDMSQAKSITSSLDMFKNIKARLDKTEFEAGKMKHDNKEYDFEAEKQDASKSKFLYDGKKLAFIISNLGGKPSVMKVNALDSKIDEKKFEVPKDYNITGM